MNQEERKTAIRRMRVLVAAACILMLLYGLRLIFLQLVNGDDFKSQATNTTDYKFTVTAARGDIVDSRGERIATSVTGYNVVLNKLLMGDEDLDGMLQKIVELLRANGENWNDTLLISQPDAAGNYTFTAEAGSTRDQKALAAMKDNLGLQQYATANDVMEKLVEDYDLASYPLSWQRTLGGIHYEMQLQAFSNVNNFIMAENVSEATVATIKEHGLSLPGVEIVETSTRSYEQSTVLPHVLGRVGKITAEKWKVTDENGQTTYPLREKGYNMNDIIGISGLESAYEEELRGKDGVETITRNSDGVIVDTALTTVPEPGHTVQLTIDSRFQKAVDKALAENIDMINRVYNRTAVCWPHPITPALTRTCMPPSTASTARTRACPCSTGRCRACTPPAPPSNLPWQWPRWIPGSSTSIPRCSATACTPFIKGTAPAAPAMATAVTSMWSRPSSGAATYSSMMWAAA